MTAKVLTEDETEGLWQLGLVKQTQGDIWALAQELLLCVEVHLFMFAFKREKGQKKLPWKPTYAQHETQTASTLESISFILLLMSFCSPNSNLNLIYRHHETRNSVLIIAAQKHNHVLTNDFLYKLEQFDVEINVFFILFNETHYSIMSVKLLPLG